MRTWRCIVAEKIRTSTGRGLFEFLWLMDSPASESACRLLARREFTLIFAQLNIRGRLILGFSVLCILLAAVVGTTVIKVRAVSESTERTVNLRVPTAMTASDLVL